MVPVDPRFDPFQAVCDAWELDASGVLDRDTATRYSETVLKPGGGKDAKELIEAFLGRDFSLDAFQKWINQTPQ